MQARQKVVIFLAVLAVVAAGWYFFGSQTEKREAIKLDNDTKSIVPVESTGPAN